MEIEGSVSEKVGKEHFQGVTVQPMLKPDGGYELIIGSSIDAQFGPVLLFGTGGQLVEVFQDRAIALPPLNSTLARRLMEQTKIYEALKGVRGRSAVNIAALEDILVKFSQLIVEQPWIREIDINPLLASAQRITALDARVVLHPPETTNFPQAAIRPYPSQYIKPWHLRDGTSVTLRPIRPEDEPLMVKFHEHISEQSVYFRYFHLMTLNSRTTHERLTRICFIDYDREMALVVDYKNPQTGEHEILGVGRLSKLHGINEGEFAMLVQDKYQCQGIGTELLTRLLEVGKDEKLAAIRAEILPENRGMQRVCEKVGFQLKRHPDIVKAGINLI
jgi:acetyltransferase